MDDDTRDWIAMPIHRTQGETNSDGDDVVLSSSSTVIGVIICRFRPQASIRPRDIELLSNFAAYLSDKICRQSLQVSIVKGDGDGDGENGGRSSHEGRTPKFILHQIHRWKERAADASNAKRQRVLASRRVLMLLHQRGRRAMIRSLCQWRTYIPESSYLSNIPEGQDPVETIRQLQELLSREKGKTQLAVKEKRAIQEKNAEKLLVVKKEMQAQRQEGKKKYEEEKSHWRDETVFMIKKHHNDWEEKKLELEEVHTKKMENVVSTLNTKMMEEALNREERAIASAVNEAVEEAGEWRLISSSFARWRHHVHRRGKLTFVVL
jgi:hypothetical protein